MERSSELELVRRQLAAIDAWAADHGVEPPSTVTMTREMRLDAARRLAARRREQEAVLARAAEHLRASGGLLHARVPVRAVIAHRNAWLCGKVADALAAAGVTVVGQYEDGADAAGSMVVEQPDLVLVEDRLPTLAGLRSCAAPVATCPARWSAPR